jgi:hypothetical protein
LSIHFPAHTNQSFAFRPDPFEARTKPRSRGDRDRSTRLTWKLAIAGSASRLRFEETTLEKPRRHGYVTMGYTNEILELP